VGCRSRRVVALTRAKYRELLLELLARRVAFLESLGLSGDQRSGVVERRRERARDLRERLEVAPGSADCPCATHELHARRLANLLARTHEHRADLRRGPDVRPTARAPI